MSINTQLILNYFKIIIYIVKFIRYKITYVLIFKLNLENFLV